MKNKTIMTIHPLNSEGNDESVSAKAYKLDFFCFLFLLEGEVLVEIDGHNYLCTASQFILCPEGRDIRIKHLKDCIGFDGCFSRDFVKDPSSPSLLIDKPLHQSFWFDDAVFMAALLKRMCIAYKDKDTAFLRSAVDLVLSQLNPNNPVSAVPDRFLNLVFRSDELPMTVSQYAKELGVTPNYLNKAVKNHTHHTAIDWIEVARINIAKSLLADRSIPIDEVSSRCGIDDQSYFSRFFKKRTGMTPSAYRKSVAPTRQAQ